MADNVLLSVKQKISKATDSQKVEEILHESLDGIDKMYSYIVYAEYANDELTGYVVQCNFSQQEDYNTLVKDKVINEILEIVSKPCVTKRIIGYNQPDLETILKTYDPLVNKLASQQRDKFKSFDYEDLCQICRLTMIKLYRKGYYIHKRLLARSFENNLLMQTRKERGKPQIVSFEDTFYASITNDSDNLTVADTIPDMELIEKEQETYRKETEKLIFEEIKSFVVDLIGIRQWNELLRDYGNKHTTAWSRKMMLKVKKHLEQNNITRKELNNKYYG